MTTFKFNPFTGKSQSMMTIKWEERSDHLRVGLPPLVNMYMHHLNEQRGSELLLLESEELDKETVLRVEDSPGNHPIPLLNCS